MLRLHVDDDLMEREVEEFMDNKGSMFEGVNEKMFDDMIRHKCAIVDYMGRLIINLNTKGSLTTTDGNSPYYQQLNTDGKTID